MNMLKKDESALLSCYLFSDLDDHEKAIALKTLHPSVRSYPAGHILLSREQFAPSLLLLLDGTLTVKREHGKKTVLLKQLQPGECFGAASMFGNCREYPTVVEALTAVRVISLTEAALSNLFLHFPKTAISHIRFLSDRIRFLNERLDATTGRDVEGKVAKFLLDASGKDALHSNWNMTQLARSLDIGRASLYRLLTQMEASGDIRLSNGSIEILNLNSIKRKANIS